MCRGEHREISIFFCQQLQCPLYHRKVGGTECSFTSRTTPPLRVIISVIHSDDMKLEKRGGFKLFCLEMCGYLWKQYFSRSNNTRTAAIQLIFQGFTFSYYHSNIFTLLYSSFDKDDPSNRKLAFTDHTPLFHSAVQVIFALTVRSTFTNSSILQWRCDPLSVCGFDFVQFLWTQQKVHPSTPQAEGRMKNESPWKRTFFLSELCITNLEPLFISLKWGVLYVTYFSTYRLDVWWDSEIWALGVTLAAKRGTWSSPASPRRRSSTSKSQVSILRLQHVQHFT